MIPTLMGAPDAGAEVAPVAADDGLLLDWLLDVVFVLEWLLLDEQAATAPAIASAARPQRSLRPGVT
jgi:hypothetical protein